MELTSLWWGFLLLGAAAGTLGSLLGVGGGILMVPMLVWVFNLPQKQAQVWSLAVMIPMTVAATLDNLRHSEQVGRIEFVPVGLMALAAIGGTMLGTYLLREMSAVTIKRAFAVLMVVAAIRMAFFGNTGDKGTRPAPGTGDARPDHGAGEGSERP